MKDARQPVQAGAETVSTHANLDLMRAVAVVTVLIDHTSLNMHHQIVGSWDLGAFGVFGVYLFFVHTCLVLMWSLERRPHTLDFYVRRVFRIYPLAMVTVVLLGLFRMPLYPVDQLTTRVFLANLFLLNNFTHGAFYMVGVLWSLPLEVQMYLFLPMLFIFARRERTFWPLLAFWAFATASARVAYGPHMGNAFVTVIPDFLPGIIAYLAYKRFSPRFPALLFPIALLACCTYFMQRPSVQRSWVVCLFLGFALPLFRDLQQPLLKTITHQIAKYSYGIYLLHPFAILFAFHHLVRQPLWIKLTVEAIGVGLMAVLGYHLIEHPMIKVGSRMANKLQQRYGTKYQADYGLDLA